MRYTKHILTEKGLSLTTLQAVGEELPFKSNYFDLVTSFQVLEHTRIPKKVLSEAVRVLKPGGYLYFVIPNYKSFWEGHYGIMWLPFLSRSKVFAKLYLKLIGKNTKFIEHIKFTTPKSVLKSLQDIPLTVSSLGDDIWEQRMYSIEFSNWALTGKLMFWVKLVDRLKLTSLAVALGKKLNLYYPIILIGKKTS